MNALWGPQFFIKWNKTSKVKEGHIKHNSFIYQPTFIIISLNTNITKMLLFHKMKYDNKGHIQPRLLYEEVAWFLKLLDFLNLLHPWLTFLWTIFFLVLSMRQCNNQYIHTYTYIFLVTLNSCNRQNVIFLCSF